MDDFLSRHNYLRAHSPDKCLLQAWEQGGDLVAMESLFDG